MNYSFRRSSEIYLVKKGVGYRINTLSNFTFSQTISEKTITRRSQFKQIAPKKIINRRRNTGTGSLEFYFSTNDPCLSILMESLDFKFDFNRGFIFDNEYSNMPKPITICLKDSLSNKQFNIKQAYITNMDVRLSPGNTTKFVFGFVYAESTEEATTAYLQQGVDPIYHAPTFIDFRIAQRQINSVKNAAFTITREVDWLTDGANQFNLGKVAHANHPVILDYNISATATANDNLSPVITKFLLPNDQDIIIGNTAFYLKLDNARLTARKNPEEVFTVSFDIKHQSLMPVLLGGTYNGHLN